MPGARLEEVVVRRGSDVAAAALVRVVPIPFLRTSIAYVLWGPMFHRHDGTRDGTALAYALKAIRHEYVVRRKGGLRVVPMLTRDDGGEWSALFRGQGYRHVVPRTPKDGLRGFFWPRTKYGDDAHLAATGAAIREALEG